MDTSQERRSDCWYHEVCDRDNPCQGCIKFIEMSYLMESSGLPKAKQKAIKLDIPSADRDAYMRLNEIRLNMDEFVEQGKNLYIGGIHTGSAKTSWSIKLMHNYFNFIWDGNGLRDRALFVHVPTFLMKCKEFDKTDTEFQKFKSKLFEVDLVVWDDIASTDMSAYDYSQILPYIDNRLLSEYSNIFNGNFDDREDLCNVLGERLTSRIWSPNSTEVIILKGKDLR